MRTLGELLSGHNKISVGRLVDITKAAEIISTHKLCCLPVLDEDRLVGVVTGHKLLGLDLNGSTDLYITFPRAVIHPGESLRATADVFFNSACCCLPVIDTDNVYIGMVTSRDVLAELRVTIDPLTGLPWSDTMRAWAVDVLRSSRELSILFLDVNDFGVFNKRYGHVVGDAVLAGVAGEVSSLVDPELDMLCRYGGDEFCIASMRHATEAADLAAEIVRAVDTLEIPSIRNIGISVTVGQWGGKRTRERDNVHYASTLNNLINLASQECLVQKRRRKEKRASKGRSGAVSATQVLLALGDEQ